MTELLSNATYLGKKKELKFILVIVLSSLFGFHNLENEILKFCLLSQKCKENKVRKNRT